MRRESPIRRGISLLMLAALGCAPLVAPPAAAQESEDPPALLLIMDSSGSMNAADGSGRTKLAAAKEALNSLVDELPERVPVGLRVYGHRVPNTDKQRGCRDSELIVPVGPLDRARMKARIGSYQAKGFTPIGLSLREGAKDLPAEGNRTIVLVSDGIDTCAPPPPCKVAKKISKQGVDLRIDTVGFQVDPKARRELRCIARVAKGSYVDAASASELSQKLRRISLRALRGYEVSGDPTTGATTPEVAPVLESGQYVDRSGIGSAEVLWYAVEVLAGQTLNSTVTMVGEPGGDFAFADTISLGLFGPDDPSVSAGSFNVAQGLGREAASTGQTLGPIGTAGEAGAFGPGTYFLRVETSDFSSDLGNRRYPLEIEVEVTGEPIAEESPEPPEDGDDPAAAGGTESGGDSNPTVTIAIALAFGLAGLATGAAVAGWVRRRVLR